MTAQMVDETGVARGKARIDYASTVGRLIDLYSDVDKASLGLPAYSLKPLLAASWSVFKFEFALAGDLVLLLPMNLIIFVRNLFPGRWHYRSFSWPYLHYCFMSVWRGEFYLPSLFIRPVTAFLLASHFRRRLRAVRRHVLLDRSIREGSRKAVVSKIDDALNVWQMPSAATVVFTYIVPTVGPIFELARAFLPQTFPSWTSIVVIMSLSYALGILGTAFLAKRGLMLGGIGRTVYFPGSVENSGVYAQEKDLLGVFGIEVTEFPLDIGVWIAAAIISFLYVQRQVAALGDMGLSDLNMSYSAYSTQIGTLLAFGGVIWLAWRRRKKLQRA